MITKDTGFMQVRRNVMYKNNIIKIILALTFTLFIFIIAITWKNIFYIENYWLEEKIYVPCDECSIPNSKVSCGFVTQEIIRYPNDKAKTTNEYKFDYLYCIVRNNNRNFICCSWLL